MTAPTPAQTQPRHDLDLLRRVREAKGMDFDLDEALADAFSPGGVHGIGPRHFGLTRSVDAVLALIAERLPDILWELDGPWKSGYGAKMWTGPEPVIVNAPTPALALLAAALEAIGMETSHADR
jgi:hypothetical protein